MVLINRVKEQFNFRRKESINKAVYKSGHKMIHPINVRCVT